MSVRRTLLALLLLATTAALADAREEKRVLVLELLEVIDAKALMQRSFESLMNAVNEPYSAGEAATDEQKRVEEELRVFRERLYQRVDYARYFEEVYVPMFEKQFTMDELRLLIDLFKTTHGQKLAQMLPDLTIGSSMSGSKLLEEAATSVRDEMSKEEDARHPWKGTMADMRSIATALEARATDLSENEDAYPTVAFDELESLLVPTYLYGITKADSWGTAFLYISDGTSYRIVSAGADKRFDWNAKSLDASATEPVLTDDPDKDIIFQDGNFVQLPKEAAPDQR